MFQLDKGRNGKFKSSSTGQNIWYTLTIAKQEIMLLCTIHLWKKPVEKQYRMENSAQDGRHFCSTVPKLPDISQALPGSISYGINAFLNKQIFQHKPQKLRLEKKCTN